MCGTSDEWRSKDNYQESVLHLPHVELGGELTPSGLEENAFPCLAIIPLQERTLKVFYKRYFY